MATDRNIRFVDIFPTGEKHKFETPCIITLKHSTTIKPYGQLIYKGNNIHIHKSVEIDLTANVELYDHVDLSEGVKIFTHKHHWNHSRGLRNAIEEIEPVSLVIEEDVYIGVGATIIGVSRIGKGAVIGTMAVLTKDVPDYEVWAGNPARKINKRKVDH